MFDVSKIVKAEGASIEVLQSIPFDKITFNGQEYTFTSSVSVEGTIKNNGGILYLEAHVRAEFVTNCARCLEEVTEEFEFDLSEEFISGEVEEDSLYLPIISNSIDLQSAVEENFCTSLPIRFLCSEDCKGLCHTCGRNLNYGDCQCETEEVDPRLAILKSFIKND